MKLTVAFWSTEKDERIEAFARGLLLHPLHGIDAIEFLERAHGGPGSGSVGAFPKEQAIVRRMAGLGVGKGAFLKRALAEATGDVVLFASTGDLVESCRRLIDALLDNGADVALGIDENARAPLEPARLRARHFATGPLAARTIPIRSIPWRSSGDAIDVELARKCSRRRFRVLHLPMPIQSRQDGRSGFPLTSWSRFAAAAVRYWAVDDLYSQDQYGAEILTSLERATRFNGWMASSVAPWIGRRVLEIGAGIGNITSFLLPRERYLATDINTAYVHYLKNLGGAGHDLAVRELDVENAEPFGELQGQFDTVLCLNVLEHVRDPRAALANMRRALEPRGRIVLYVPQGPWLYSPLDRVLEHRCRYTKAQLETDLVHCGFAVERVEDFNRLSTLGWLLNGRLLGRRRFGRMQLKLFDCLVPLIRRIDAHLPLPGLGLIAVARRVELDPALLPGRSTDREAARDR